MARIGIARGRRLHGAISGGCVGFNAERKGTGFMDGLKVLCSEGYGSCRHGRHRELMFKR